MDEGRRGNISSEAVFDVLRVLTRTDHPLGVAELHKLTGEPTSSVHRAISTLEETGYASRHRGAARFSPGPMCSHLVRAVVARYAIARTARSYLARLVDLSGGVGTLNVRLGWYSVRLLSLDGRTEYVETRRIGQPRYLHQDLAPLTILAFMGEADRGRYLAFAERETGRSATELGIPALVAGVRRSDHTVMPDRTRAERAWIGFPLFHPEDGRVFASFAVSAPVAAPDLALPADLLAEMIATVGNLHQDLAADPGRCASPYRDIDPDTIRLPVDPV